MQKTEETDGEFSWALV